MNSPIVDETQLDHSQVDRREGELLSKKKKKTVAFIINMYLKAMYICRSIILSTKNDSARRNKIVFANNQ